MECELHYYMHMAQSDIDKMDISEVRWKHGWLKDVKEKESKSIKKKRKGQY